MKLEIRNYLFPLSKLEIEKRIVPEINRIVPKIIPHIPINATLVINTCCSE